MKKLSIILMIFIALTGCSNPIKNEEAKVVVEPGTAVVEETQEAELDPAEVNTEITKIPVDKNDLYGFYVGYFEQDVKKESEKKTLDNDAGFYWNKENKINISIDEIQDTVVIGHSVVAGNDRPFKGTVLKSVSQKDGSDIYTFSVREPGNDRYDGEFNFRIENGRMIGKWEAYKNINIKKRKYNLEKKFFKYDPKITLEYNTYVDWTKTIDQEIVIEEDGKEIDSWIETEFASATGQIYEVNASTDLLDKNLVANFKKGDLTIIRNTIYARHGYSFRNLPLRVFFDAQDWYIPVHADIKADFTDIEKKNIELLLSFEENAAEYYDRFGR
ncbi:MAG: YARHG domain-containing protein [Bacteroidota bacterium]